MSNAHPDLLDARAVDSVILARAVAKSRNSTASEPGLGPGPGGSPVAKFMRFSQVAKNKYTVGACECL
jgi:hypothetical protein